VHPILDDQFGGGIEQHRFGPLAALCLGTAVNGHVMHPTRNLSSAQQVCKPKASYRAEVLMTWSCPGHFSAA
jgi:hypothetical protein